MESMLGKLVIACLLASADADRGGPGPHDSWRQ
jgi:hypothetical protein